MSRILLVDDDHMVRSTVASQLAHSGHIVIAAGGGREGLNAAKANEVDLILLDIMMPDLDGMEFITLFRRGGSATPILAMTGGMKNEFEKDPNSGAERYLDFAHKLGADAVLRKPFTRQQLLACIESLLGDAHGRNCFNRIP